MAGISFRDQVSGIRHQLSDTHNTQITKFIKWNRDIEKRK